MSELAGLRCFHCPDIPGTGASARLPEEEARHLFNVLRARPGESVGLLDGRGVAAVAVVRDGKALEVVTRSVQAPPRRRVILHTATPRRNQMEQLARQAVEAGADAIVPLIARRSVAVPEGEAALRRWAREALEACKQSRNPFFPDIQAPLSFEKAVAHARQHCDITFIGSPSAPCAFPRLPPLGKGGIGLFIGPEGGFTPEEEEELAAAGFTPVRLARHVMRVETAAVAGVAALSRLALSDEPPA